MIAYDEAFLDACGPRLSMELTSSVLLELTRTLVSSLDFQEILYILVSRVAAIVEVDRVSIVLVPDEGGAGYVVAASDDQKLTNLKLDLAKYPEIRHVLAARPADDRRRRPSPAARRSAQLGLRRAA